MTRILRLIQTHFFKKYSMKQTVLIFNIEKTKKITHNTIVRKTSKSLIVAIKLQIERHTAISIIIIENYF